MKTKIITLTLLCISLNLSYGQKISKWENWKWLTGTWVGEGTGQPGQGKGSFTFAFDLDSNILTRRSHSEYPAEGNKTEIIHDDLMIVYPDNTGIPSKAVYFDNEGHTIFYNVSFGQKSIILTGEKVQNMPVFRLTYSLLDTGLVDTKFEISQDGQKFMTYVEGRSKMVKN